MTVFFFGFPLGLKRPVGEEGCSYNTCRSSGAVPVSGSWTKRLPFAETDFAAALFQMPGLCCWQ